MVPIQRILCPIDFSDASRHAIGHATAIARWYRASLTALHVYNPAWMSIPGAPLPDDRLPEADVNRLYAATAASCENARTLGVDVSVLVDIGQPAKDILDRASTLPAGLIVMGTHGTSGFEHFVLGSVTERVLRKAPCPVLTVPPHAQGTSRLPYRRLLCAVDFSEPSRAGLELACSLAQESDAQLTLVHVIEWPWEEPPPPALDELPRAQALALDEFRRHLERSATVRLDALLPAAVRERCQTTQRVVHGKPYVEILRVAAREDADLIVMGVHGRHTADLMLFGSTTNQIVRRATCPVLTLRH